MALFTDLYSTVLFEFYGIICAAMAYVVVLALSYLCIHALVNGKGSSSYSTAKRRFNILYISLVLLLSTFSLIQEAYGTTMTLFFLQESGGSWFDTIPVAFPFTVWAANGIMIWRCIVLYQGVSTKYQILLIIALFFLALISLAAGSIYLIPFSSHEIFIYLESGPMYQEFDRAALIVPTASTIVNIVLSALIVFRVLYHQRHIRKALGTTYTSIYSQIVVLCIESCALISVVGVVYMIIVLSNLPGIEVPLYLLPQICAMSPFMIIYRDAYGRDATGLKPSLSVGNMVEREIHFITPNSTREEV